jgi:hypothetical protein
VERFYIILTEPSKDSEDTLSVYRHTLPYFLPVSLWASSLLPNALSEFIEIAEAHLNAFVARREMWKGVLATYQSSISDESVSQPHDLIAFRVQADGR